MTARGAQRAAQADFGGALHDPHQGDIGNADGPDHQGQPAQHHEHHVQVGLHIVAHPPRLRRHLHLQYLGVVGAQRPARLFGDQARRAHAGLDHHQTRAGQSEVASRRALGNDYRAQQLGLAPDIGQHPDHQKQMVADKHRGQLLQASDAQFACHITTDYGHLVGARRVAGIGQAARRQPSPHRRIQLGRGRAQRQLERALTQRVFHRRCADQTVAHCHLAECARRHHAVQPLQTGRRIPGQGQRVNYAGPLAGPPADEQLSGGQLVELADDAVACGACQTQRGHQRRQPDHHTQHRQHHSPGARKNAGQCLVEQVAQRHARAHCRLRLACRRGGHESKVRHAVACVGRRAVGRRFNRRAGHRNVRCGWGQGCNGQAAVDNLHPARGHAGHLRVMRDHHQGQAVLVELLEQLENAGTVA